jgi:hypothetical protein
MLETEIKITTIPTLPTLDRFMWEKVQGMPPTVIYDIKHGKFYLPVSGTQTTGTVREIPTKEVLEDFIRGMFGQLSSVAFNREIGAFKKS